jgi:ribonuclease P protein component
MARDEQASAGGIPAPRPVWHGLASADFAAALARPACAKSPHFALHHVAGRPRASGNHASKPLVPDLSTADAPIGNATVDNPSAPGQWWLGLVVPKRLARRSVTRNLVKRQMRAHADGHRDRLPAGQWVIRLRAPFDPRLYPSAASAQLRAAARVELAQVFASAVVA